MYNKIHEQRIDTPKNYYIYRIHLKRLSSQVCKHDLVRLTKPKSGSSIFFVKKRTNMYQLLNRIQQWAKKAKGAIRTAVKKMINFFFIFRLFTFHVLRMFCRIRDFFLLLADLMMRTFSIYVLFPLILIGWGIKEFALFIYPYGWIVIFSDILLICFGERLKQFLAGIFWKNFRVHFKNN